MVKSEPYSEQCYDTYPALEGTREIKPIQFGYNTYGLSGLYCKYAAIRGDKITDCYSNNPLSILNGSSLPYNTGPTGLLSKCSSGIQCTLPSTESFTINISLNELGIFNGLKPVEYNYAAVLVEGDIARPGGPGFMCTYDYSKTVNDKILISGMIDSNKTSDTSRIKDFNCIYNTLNGSNSIVILGSMESNAMKQYYFSPINFLRISVIRQASGTTQTQFLPVGFALSPQISNRTYSFSIDSAR